MGFLAYCKVRITKPLAKHIMCAYAVASKEDSCDDGEHHGGLLMSNELKKKKYSEVALFITRQGCVQKFGS